MRGVAASLVLVSSALSAHAAPGGLQAAVDTAISRNPSIRQMQERVSQSEADRRRAFSLLLAQVDAVTTANYRRDAANTGNLRFGGTTYDQYSFSLRFTQPLLAFGLLSAVDMPARDIDLARIDLEIATRDLTANVIRAYFGLILAERKVAILKSSEKLDQDTLATAQKRYKTGRSQLLDVLQAKTQLALLSSQLAQEITRARVQAAELANLLGDPNSGRFDLVGTLELPHLEKMKASMPTSDKPKLPEFERVLTSMSRLDLERSVVLGAHWPKLDFVGNWGRTAFAREDLLDGNASAWTLGLQLTIPIFSGFSSFYERQSFASRASQLEYQQSLISNRLALEQIKSRESLEVAQTAITASVEAFDLAQKSLTEAKKNFAYSTIDLLQLISVQEAYLSAETALDQARYDYLLALVAHYSASGLPLGQLVEMISKN